MANVKCIFGLYVQMKLNQSITIFFRTTVLKWLMTCVISVASEIAKFECLCYYFKMISEIKAWGERSLISGLVDDLHNNLLTINFIREIEFLKETNFSFEEPVSVLFFIEPDFNDFGSPDLLIKIQTNGHKYLFFIEAKRKTYKKSSISIDKRTKDGFNSSINGQIELNYRFSRLLREYKVGDKELTEGNWVLNSGYRENLPANRNKKEGPKLERKDRLKTASIKNPTVLNKIIADIAGGNFFYYHVVLTNDTVNPFNSSDTILPCIFSEIAPKEDQFSKFKKNLGFINYDRIEFILKGIINSKFLAALNMNEDNML